MECSAEVLGYLLDMVESDSEPYVRSRVIEMMIDNPMFKQREDNNLNTQTLVHRLWDMMK